MALYVIITEDHRDAAHQERTISDVAAVVVDPGGSVRICVSGKEDEHVDTKNTSVVVVPDHG